MNILKKIFIIIGVIFIFLGLYRFMVSPYFFTSYISLFVLGGLSIMSAFSFQGRIIKALDFFIQAIPITWLTFGIVSGRMRGQGFLGVFVFGFLILLYQFLSSIIIAVRQSLKNELSKTGLIRLILCISIACLLLLMFVANRNCWSVQDILTFSNKEVTDYKNYYALHKGEPFVSPLCVQLTASNDSLITQTIFVFYMCPLFFILTLIERSLDMIKMVNKRT